MYMRLYREKAMVTYAGHANTKQLQPLSQTYKTYWKYSSLGECGSKFSVLLVRFNTRL